MIEIAENIPRTGRLRNKRISYGVEDDSEFLTMVVLTSSMDIRKIKAMTIQKRSTCTKNLIETGLTALSG